MKLLLTLLLLTLTINAKDVSVKQLFSVDTVKVQKLSTQQRIKNYGFVTIDEARTYDIAPRFGGYVEELYANKMYKRVKKGDALVTVYSPEVYKAKDEYLNTYKYTKTRPNKTMLDSARLKLQLLGISDDEINDVLKNKKSSPNTTIYSPIDGYVFIKSVDNGSAFNAKQKLFQIVNLDEVWVEAKLFEEERARLSTTNDYELTFKGLSKTYKTSKKLLYPELDPKIATLTLRLRVNNDGHKLFPGMYATVVSLKDSSKQLILPTTAVIRKNAKYYVFMVGDFKGEYEPREVQVKVLNTQSYIILNGLRENDTVVNNALFMLDSDAQINGLY